MQKKTFCIWKNWESWLKTFFFQFILFFRFVKPQGILQYVFFYYQWGKKSKILACKQNSKKGGKCTNGDTCSHDISERRSFLTKAGLKLVDFLYLTIGMSGENLQEIPPYIALGTLAGVNAQLRPSQSTLGCQTPKLTSQV